MRHFDFPLSLQEHQLSCRLCFLPVSWPPQFPFLPRHDIYNWGLSSKYSPSSVLLGSHTLFTLSGKTEPKMNTTPHLFYALSTAGPLKAAEETSCSPTLVLILAQNCSCSLCCLCLQSTLLPSETCPRLYHVHPDLQPAPAPHRQHLGSYPTSLWGLKSLDLISVNFPSPFTLCLI